MQKKNSNKKTKITLIIISIAFIAILLIPYDCAKATDGGSSYYHAIAYTVVYHHTIHIPKVNTGKITYTVGWTVNVFGHEVYNNCHEEEEPFKSSI